MVGCDIIFVNFWASSPSYISEVWTGGPFMCDRQSTLGYMIRCSKQSTITITSLGQVVQFLKRKLYVQKEVHDLYDILGVISTLPC